MKASGRYVVFVKPVDSPNYEFALNSNLRTELEKLNLGRVLTGILEKTINNVIGTTGEVKMYEVK